MCGITGFIDNRRTIQDLRQMTDRLYHRGPDDEGFFFENGVGLGHRRLSIIDLSSGGHQPMLFDQLVIVFNGEIYNYKEVKLLLQKASYSFSSSSDTEVVIKAFHCWRERCLDYFIGMFSFAIYDKCERSLFLFRDRVGVKPLYYYHYREGIAFASEVKAFKKFLDPKIKTELNEEAISSFFRFGYISNNQSIIKNVFKLPPGHYLKYADNKINIKKYWSVDFEEDTGLADKSENELLDELEALAVSSFKYRMVADVPVGVFLSAGIDSSLVAAILSKHFGQIHTFTIGFSEKKFDESCDAKKIANYLNTIHTEAFLDSKKGLEILDHFYDIYDEPHGDNSCVPTTFVSSLAKENGVKVVLSADGGDELFGGYSRYPGFIHRWRQIERNGKFASRLLQHSLRLLQHLSSTDIGYKYNRFSSIADQNEFSNFYQAILRPNSDKQLSDLLVNYSPAFDSVRADNPLNQMMEWDFHHYLPDDNLVKVDRATMYNSIEGREPFLDHRLIEFAAKLPVKYKVRGEVTKYLLKKLLERYLPLELFDLPKRGFAAPLQLWMKNSYGKDINSIFHPDSFNNPYLNKKTVLAFISKYQKKVKVNMVTLWFLYSFQKWYMKWNEE